VNAGMQLYVATIVVYFAVYSIATLGLSIQYSYAGVVNLGFIVFQAAGAYTAAVLTLGPDTSIPGFQTYVLGYNLPFPIPLLAAAAVGAILSVAIGVVALKKLRRDYQAIVFLVLSVVATDLVTSLKGLFNGQAGLALIPSPLQKELGLSYLDYHWAYAIYALVLTVGVYVLCKVLSNSPLGVAWRASRDNESSAAAVGKNVPRIRLSAMAVGGALAGLSGAVLVQFITVWQPNSWLFPETFVLFTALIVGGVGNSKGLILGVIAVPILLLQAPGYLPEFGHAGLIDALEWVIVGFVTMVFLWFRPRGILPERPRRLDDYRSGGIRSALSWLRGQRRLGKRAT
jgi:ABC-type branched-subunit amino acid transport system permease subunit